MSESPLILAIETSNPNAPSGPDPLAGPGVCLLRHDEMLAHAALEPKDRHDDALLPAIDRACTQAGVVPRDIDRVGVSVGPGGYTTIRIAVTVAKSIAEAVGCGCVGVPTAAGVVRAAGIVGPSLVALAWKRDDVWVQAYEGERPVESGRIVKIAELPGLSAQRTLIAEDRLLEQFEHTGAHAAPIFIARAIAEITAAMTPVNPVDLLPLYPREPEAVRKWNALGR